ncbi:hypothetical protein L6452_22499 [Arctium lappa]|uniref:Uncharacterized protein n=1 Tax=Arctium lappa TaxID=4217 RepID=A0ACB9B0T8_ARCLA|nr:hypothetical protein L6452_22499 [Arctium lappa]
MQHTNLIKIEPVGFSVQQISISFGATFFLHYSCCFALVNIVPRYQSRLTSDNSSLLLSSLYSSLLINLTGYETRPKAYCWTAYQYLKSQPSTLNSQGLLMNSEHPRLVVTLYNIYC